ncbi:type IVB secretion system protein IcmH/DotU [Polymorphobacter megasporae]|uniref:type IVB secretion system protein IcmH/DotU n=1 Tax=Glacieibacterium megasporae TaxID=2835787 RepID=UPI001C1DD38D|nr:type IVB secretion system protein IcmH/DotU [Polymorphobacter megasporae]UAJ11320.1 type IVB secretion system protein IcmH/DotU [Polymorphobacter megasporae]
MSRSPFTPDGDRTQIGAPPGGDRTEIGAPGPFDRPASAPRPSDDSGDRTMIGASTGGAIAASPFAPAKLTLDQLPSVGGNPLIAAGTPLIALAGGLRTVLAQQETGRLRRIVIEELRRFQARTRESSIGEEEIRYGHYALCALLDEVIMSTPWGVGTGWGKQSLVATFHNEVVSGDRMFEVADALEARPGRSPALLELLYVCFSFGFEGRLRLERGGASKLLQLRERLYTAIRNLRGPIERELSPQWKGIDAAYRPIAADIPLWVLLAGFAALMLLIYAGFVFTLGLVDGSARPLGAIYAAGPAKLARAAPAPPSDNRLYLTILDILKPDIDAGRVGVTDDPGAVGVRLLDRGLFASGSADLDAGFGPTMGRVAQAIGLVTGPVAVAGHTDAQPIRSLRFPSNQSLSEARASAVVAALTAAGVPGDRLKPTGYGETQPIADNKSESARRLNRRVEVTIPKTYAETPR